MHGHAAQLGQAADIAADRAGAHHQNAGHRFRASRVGEVAQMGRADAPLDLGQQGAAPAEREHRLADDKHRTDQQADQVVHKGRLAAFVVMADELEHPAHDKTADADDQPTRRRALRGGQRQRREQTVGDGGGDTEHQVAACEIPERRQRPGQDGQVHRLGRQRELDARQQRADREDDQRDADEVGRDIASIAVVGGVLRHQVEGGAEQAGHARAPMRRMGLC
mmetsp:Transcript_69598/g.163675  ORF Transcript_69598/g.163675 Transcript_69598/m.163675 type:complete len:223 (+) Transcript_69598:1-669(+)